MQEGGLYWKPGVQYGEGQPVKSMCLPGARFLLNPPSSVIKNPTEMPGESSTENWEP